MHIIFDFQMTVQNLTKWMERCFLYSRWMQRVSASFPIVKSRFLFTCRQRCREFSFCFVYNDPRVTFYILITQKWLWIIYLSLINWLNLNCIYYNLHIILSTIVCRYSRRPVFSDPAGRRHCAGKSNQVSVSQTENLARGCHDKRGGGVRVWWNKEGENVIPLWLMFLIVICQWIHITGLESRVGLPCWP